MAKRKRKRKQPEGYPDVGTATRAPDWYYPGLHIAKVILWAWLVAGVVITLALILPSLTW